MVRYLGVVALFIEIQKNLISSVVLVILFFSLIRQLNWKNYINKVFFYLIGLNFSLLLLDTIIILLNGNDGLVASIILHTVVGVYFVLPPMFALLWLYYVDTTIFNNRKRLVKLSIIPGIMFVVNFVFVIASYFSDLIFNINESNLYTLGSHYYISVIAPFLIMILANYDIIKNKEHIRKKEFGPLLLFSIPPIIAALILVAFKDVNIVLSSLVISHLLIYIYVQSRITSTDFLTGLFNRREYETIIRDLSYMKQKNLTVSGIMVDINDFKNINDVYGHRIGDEILVHVSKLLKSTIRSQDYVFRIGGDEFVIVIISDKKDVVNEIMNRIEHVVHDFNKQSPYDFSISLSLGKGIYDEHTYVDLPSFFEHLDLMMYDDKKYFKKNQS
jgi:diguanylate cyclase (GGDEF)-like protein